MSSRRRLRTVSSNQSAIQVIEGDSEENDVPLIEGMSEEGITGEAPTSALDLASEEGT